MNLLLTAVLFAMPLLQYNPKPIVNTQAVASFTGTLKSADKKWVLLAVENGETLKMFVTAKTKFVRNGKPAKPADFHDGESVTVDAERDVRLNMLAVRVAFPIPKPIEEK